MAIFQKVPEVSQTENWKNITDQTVYVGKRHHWGMKPLLGVVSTSGNRVDAPWRFGSQKTSCMVEIFQPFPEAADPSWDCRVDRLCIMVFEVAAEYHKSPYCAAHIVHYRQHGRKISQFSFHPKQRNCHRIGSQFPATFEFHTHCVQANSCPGPNIWTTTIKRLEKWKNNHPKPSKINILQRLIQFHTTRTHESPRVQCPYFLHPIQFVQNTGFSLDKFIPSGRRNNEGASNVFWKRTQNCQHSAHVIGITCSNLFRKKPPETGGPTGWNLIIGCKNAKISHIVCKKTIYEGFAIPKNPLIMSNTHHSDWRKQPHQIQSTTN